MLTRHPSNSSVRPQYLYLDNNYYLSGSLPSTWSALTSLYYVQLSNNLFSGTIPPMSFTTLTQFYASNNSFSGTIQARCCSCVGQHGSVLPVHPPLSLDESPGARRLVPVSKISHSPRNLLRHPLAVNCV